MISSREEELARLIAEQGKDAEWGHRIDPVRVPTNHQRVSVDFAFEDGDSAADVIGRDDENLKALNGEDATIIRRIPIPQKWTRRMIVSRIQKWVREHGELPVCKDWKRPNGRGIPSASSVARAFGSWNAGIEAAGFDPRPVGGSSHHEELQGRRLVRRIRRQKRTAYLTPEQVSAAYVLYDRRKLSMPQLVEMLWESYGYRSRETCYTALLRAFHAEGFRMRTKREAAQLVPKEKRIERGRLGSAARWSKERAA